MEKRGYGTWPGRLSAADVAAGGLRFSGLARCETGLAWIEGRPDEGGRCVVVVWDGKGAPRDILPPPYSARSRVNEYGGGAMWIDEDALVFVNDADQDLYRIDAQGGIDRLTDMPGWRFADGNAQNGQSFAVAEIHESDGLPQTCLCAVDHATGEARIVAEGRDFYAAPRLSPDGDALVWLAWDLPFMPWQAAELWWAPVNHDGGLGPARLIGGGLNRAAFQPAWSADGVLHCVLEGRDGGRLCRWEETGWQVVGDVPGEAGRPQWTFDIRSYALRGAEGLAVMPFVEGKLRLALVDASGGVEMPETGFIEIDMMTSFDGKIAGVLAFPDRPQAIAVVDTDRPSAPTIIRPSGAFDLPDGDVSDGTLKRFETGDGPVYGLYYPPQSASFAGLSGEAPPMVISAHGGPTSYAGRGFAAKIQFWTQRGFAYLDVDYRGSVGYGPAYRRALDGQMGIVDIGDTVAAARAAAEAGLADPARLMVSGGSAGGYVVLGALAFHDVFRAGCSKYGIGDLKVLADTTHKFEAGYLDTLLGLTGDPSHDTAILRDRSPIHAVGQITAPVLLLQGLDDKVVPPDQSRDMADALKANGNPVALVEFEGEGHGFRRAETVIAALELEYAFYCAILGLAPAESLPDLEIANWP